MDGICEISMKEGYCMDNIDERISYLEGLADGMDLFNDKKEGKFYSELINILSDVNHSMEHMTNRLTELEEYVEAIDEDLNDIEWDYYEDEDDDDQDQDYFEQIEEDVVNDEDNEYYQVVCPSCHESVMVKENVLENNQISEIVCPNCKEVLIVDDYDHSNERNPQFHN